LHGKKITSYPGDKNNFNTSDYLEENVVVDKNLITSRGVGTAIDFALTLISAIKGEDAKKETADRILWSTQ
jgi:4-methyl-5(b-hydroxyethyl)-thiazole monophosphate biosynthesis